MNIFRKKKGFTLLELMIVVIIIGILASLAMPRFIKATNRAKEAEARSLLGVIRASQVRYYLESNNLYHGDTDLADGSLLDVDIMTSQYYTYKALAGTGADPDIGEATAKSGTGLTTLKIKEGGTIN